MPDNAARIAEIRELLASGVQSASVDGVNTTFDLESLRKELARLEAEDVTLQTTRPRVAQIYLGGF
jgi:hypothetical protein